MLTKKRDNASMVFFAVILLVTGFLAVAFFVSPVSAQVDTYEQGTADLILSGIGVEVGVIDIVVGVINAVLGVLGLIGVIFVMYGGFVWMTSRGDSKRIEKARKIIINAVIGLVVVLLSYFIVRVVIGAVHDWADGELGGGGGGGGGIIIPPGEGDPRLLRLLEVQTTSVEDDSSQNVYLCSSVQSIFNNTLEQSTVDAAVNSTLRIVERQGGTETLYSDDLGWQSSSKYITYRQLDGREFSVNSDYRLYVPVSLRDVMGNNLTECLASPNCSLIGTEFAWDFSTGDETDKDEPYVTNHSPRDGATGVSLSPYVKINFSEPIDALTVTPDSIRVTDSSGNQVNDISGFNISSKTVSFGFITDLIEYETYTVSISGITDLCSLEMANYSFSFSTGNEKSGIRSSYPSGNSVCPDSDILFSSGTTLEGHAVSLHLRSTNDNRDIGLLPGEASSTVSGVGRLSVLNEGFTSFEFVPEGDLWTNTEYSVEIETNKQIDMEGNTVGYEFSFETTTQEECVCSPYVSRISPSSGGPGQCLTIFGRCFTGKEGDEAVPTSINFRTTEVTPAPASWTGSSIVTTLPTSMTTADSPVPISVSIQYASSGEQSQSNEREFQITSDDIIQGPCLYNISPSSGRTGSTVTATGTRFGDTSGSFIFNPAVYATLSGAWTSTKVRGLAPDGGASGDVYITDNLGRQSNPLYFEYLTGGGTDPGTGTQYLRMVNDSRCVESDDAVIDYPSPNPKKNSSDACRNSIISARFNKRLQPASVNSSNISVFACGSDAENLDCTVNVSGSITHFSYDEDSDGFRFTPGLLSSDTYYQVMVNPGINAIDGTTLQRQVDWYFKTQDTDVSCDIKSVNVVPSSWNTRISGSTKDYTAEAFAASCREISAGNWSWVSSDSNIATVSPTVESHIATVTVTASAAGQADITATQGSRSDFGVIKFNPDACSTDTDCLDYAGDGSYLCPGSICDIPTKRCTPVINSMTPNQGPISSWSTLTGCYFGGSRGTLGEVTFGGTQAEYTNCGSSAWSDTQAIIEVPPAAGNSVVLTSRYGLTSNSVNYTVSNQCSNGAAVPQGGVPGLCSISPSSGWAGSQTDLDGNHLISGTYVDDNAVEPQCEDYECDRFADVCQGTDPDVPEFDFVYTDSALDYFYGGHGNCCGDDSAEYYIEPDEGTGLCCSTPDSQVINGRCVISTEDQITPPGHSILFGTTRAVATAWSNTDISNITVPEITDSVNVTVEINSCPSNPVAFTLIGSSCDNNRDDDPETCSINQSLCPPDLYCAPDCTCQVPADPEPANVVRTLPQDNATNICSNTSVSIFFDRKMDSNSLRQDIEVYGPCPEDDGGGGRDDDSTSTVFLKKTWVAIKNFISGIKSVLAQPDGLCLVEGGVRTTRYSDDTLLGEGVQATKAIFYPTKGFAAGQNYQVYVGRKNIAVTTEGGGLNSHTFDFTTRAAGICAIDRVDVIPSSMLFTVDGQAYDFEGIAYSSDDQQLNPTDESYPFSWQWSKLDDDIVLQDVNGTNQIQTVTARNKNGYATIYATASTTSDSIPENLQAKKTDSAAITVFLCENFVKIVDTEPSTYYRTMYCRGLEGAPDDELLPTVNQRREHTSSDPNVMAENFLLVDGSNDAIGLRVYSNYQKLSAKEWYLQQAPNATASGQSTMVDGYDAYRVGNTVYVAAVYHDIGVSNNLYYNTYVISYNADADNDTLNIYNQLLGNWQFNDNITDFNARAQLHRDLDRIAGIGDIASYLETYYTTQGEYPALENGSYIEGQSVSVWPSWQNTFSNALGRALPVDPVNAFNLPCSSDTDLNDRLDQVSCWGAISEDNQVFECPDGSHVYIFNSTGDTYSLYVNMEYDAVDWSTIGGFNRNASDACTEYQLTP